MKNIKILAIETSCDETAASVVKNGREVLSNIINSQISTHKVYGGVVPEIASRKHMENINQVVTIALKEANTDIKDLDAIATTYGPGLVGALLVGTSFTKAMALTLKKPIIAVNHIEGHISANYIENKNLEPPFAALIVSGGHTYLTYVKDYGEYEIIGQTVDDAIGEAFDKVARALDLPYPGGPHIDKLAKMGEANIPFPKASIKERPMDFSFSGIKSAVLNYLNTAVMQNKEIKKEDVAASFQNVAIDSVVSKAISLCKEKEIKKLAIAGGVASNSLLREVLKTVGEEEKIEIFMPSPIMCTDNAAMIGVAAYYKYLKKDFANYELNANPSLCL